MWAGLGLWLPLYTLRLGAVEAVHANARIDMRRTQRGSASGLALNAGNRAKGTFTCMQVQGRMAIVGQ
jgi:hypothetical protein